MSKRMCVCPGNPSGTASNNRTVRQGAGYLADAGAIGKVLLIALAMALPARAAAPGIGLLEHRAVYELRLDNAAGSSAVSSAEGLLIVSIEDTCDSWRVQQGLVLTIGRDEAEISTSSSFDSREAKDGSWYTFKDEANTQPGGRELSEGEAHAGNDIAGMVFMTEPDVAQVALPPGTLFPTAQLIDILARAAAGERFLSHVIYDGTDGTTIYDATTAVGAPHVSTDNGMMVWPVRLAFFVHGGSAEMPDMEISAELRQDGVSESLLFDYGQFSLVGKLKSLEVLPPGSC